MMLWVQLATRLRKHTIWNLRRVRVHTGIHMSWPSCGPAGVGGNLSKSAATRGACNADSCIAVEHKLRFVFVYRLSFHATALS